MPKFNFETRDLLPDLPDPGRYPARIEQARFRDSASGNRMLVVIYALADVTASRCRASEYFVLEGASEFGILRARRRLADLYFAAGLEPKPGDEIVADDLVGAELEIEVDHEQWQGRTRLVVAGHHFRCRADAQPAPF